MTDLMKTLALIGALMAGSAALAQDTTSTEEATEDTGLDMGTPVDAEPQVGQLYIRETFGDWEVRCVLTEEDNDPCQINQTLFTADEPPASIAEISMFPLSEEGQAAAGATIAVPLLTLLTEQVTIVVDGGAARRYNFSWCGQEGCYARVGFTADEINAFKRGNGAVLTIVPVAAPDQQVNLNISLSGFTAAYDSIDAAAE